MGFDSLPEGWQLRCLNDIAHLLNGYAFQSNQYVEDGIRIIRITNVQSGSIVDDSPKFYPQSSYEEHKKYELIDGDLLISLTGNVGRTGIIDSKLLPAYLNQRVGCIRVNDANLYNIKYLYYYFQQGEFINKCISASKGMAQLNLSTKWLENVQMPFPHRELQDKIVGQIEELLTELENSNSDLIKAKQQLKIYKQLILQKAYNGELTQSWREKKPYSTATTKLGHIAEIKGGITKGRNLNPDETIELPYLRVANVQDGYLDLSTMLNIKLKASEQNTYLLQYGDVLYTEGGDKDKLGRGTVWKNEIPVCVHQNHVFRARVNPAVATPEFVAYYSMTPMAKKYFYNNAKQTVNLASINMTVLKNLEIQLPPIEEQRKIVEEIDAHFSVFSNIEKTIEQSLQKAETLRQCILMQAFEGKLV